MSDLVARLQTWREAVILPRWIIDDVKELVRAKAELEAKLEATERDAAAWRQSWRDAKDQAIELAAAILEAPYTQPSLRKWNVFMRLAHGIVGDPAAAQEPQPE